MGDVATIINRTSAPSASIQPTSEILIDLSGRPDLVAAAKEAVSDFLSDNSDSSAKRKKANSSSSGLIQAVDQTQFAVRLRTVVTGDVRNELAKKGSPSPYVHLHSSSFGFAQFVTCWSINNTTGSTNSV